jgi:class 3 adenylate cyclase/pimeloyl-ACP methyl ester carboxylesterase
VSPDVHYAKASGGIHVAYQVVGDGPIDLVVVPGWISNVEMAWQEPAGSYTRRLANLARLILFDKRGTGLSDRVAINDLPDLETRMDDIRAVMDAAGSERAVIYAASEGGSLATLFAATYPDRAIALILYGASPRYAWAPDYPWGTTRETLDREIDIYQAGWGTIEGAADELSKWAAPSVADDPVHNAWFAEFMRSGASPGAAAALDRMNFEIDVRHVLPTINVPTLVLNREGDEPDEGRWQAEQIPGAIFEVLPGVDHLPWVGEVDALADRIESFVKEMREEEAELDRFLATVLFTDIVGSTETATQLGDRRWKELLEAHHARVRGHISRYRGREIDTAGDGFFASFDGPARAIRCASAIVSSVRDLGLEVRAGLHTGECELIGDKIGGMAVHIGARVAAEAHPGEILVSNTVKDLVAGSGLRFEDRGEHELKGVPGPWRLYALV